MYDLKVIPKSAILEMVNAIVLPNLTAFLMKVQVIFFQTKYIFEFLEIHSFRVGSQKHGNCKFICVLFQLEIVGAKFQFRF